MLSRYNAEAALVSVLRHDMAAMQQQARKLEATTQAMQALGPSSDVAFAYSELAFFRSLSDRPAAIALYRSAVDQFDRAPTKDLAQKAFALKRWGALLLAEKRLAEAEQRYRAALAIEKQLGTDPFSLSFTLSDLGLAERLQGRFPQAVAYYEEALQIREAAYRADPNNIRAITGLASTLMYLAWVHSDAGRPKEAAPLAWRSVELRKRADLAPASNQASRSKLALGQLELASLLRKQNVKENAADIRTLIEAVKETLKRNPDNSLEAQVKELEATQR